jgi:GNAT superfamily N-acetyltransferase
VSDDVHTSVRPGGAGELDRAAARWLPRSPTTRWCATSSRRGCARATGASGGCSPSTARSLALGGLWTTGDGDAAAVWFPPGRWRPTPREDLRELPAWLRIGGRRSPAFSRLRSAMFAHHGELPPHWYLLYLGARPGRQGRGLGSALLQAALDRCDAERVPAYLESTCARNVPVYRRHGFVEQGTLDVPAGCPPLTPMWRDPR